MPGALVVVFSVVVVLVCAKANGAINAQARLRIVLFILFPSFCLFELTLPRLFGLQAASGRFSTHVRRKKLDSLMRQPIHSYARKIRSRLRIAETGKQRRPRRCASPACT